MRISDWSSDVCSSDLPDARDSQQIEHPPRDREIARLDRESEPQIGVDRVIALILQRIGAQLVDEPDPARSEEHTSELQSLMRISYAVFCLKKKKKIQKDK